MEQPNEILKDQFRNYVSPMNINQNAMTICERFIDDVVYQIANGGDDKRFYVIAEKEHSAHISLCHDLAKDFLDRFSKANPHLITVDFVDNANDRP